MRKRSNKIWCLVRNLTLSLFLPTLLYAQTTDKPLRVLLHVHSEISGDEITIEEIAHQAQKIGVDSVILSEYFQQKISYVFLSYQKPSALRYGLKHYFEDVRRVNLKVPEVILIPGVEATPFYWYSGNILKGDWTVYDLQKNLLAFGAGESVLEGLPTLENSRLKLSSGYGRGEKAYQAVIDHIENQNGFAVWSTPDEAFGAEFKKGPLQFRTPPYHESLLATDHYSGFGFYPEGSTKTGIAGGGWDWLLGAYCRGRRAKPVWAFAEAVIHRRNFLENFGIWDNIVLAAEFSEAGILAAMRAGRFYIRENKGGEIRLETFQVADASGTRAAGMGETLMLPGRPRIRVKAANASGLGPQRMILEIIRNAEIVHTETGEQGIVDFVWDDPKPLEPNRKSYYRLTITTRPNNVAGLVSNPIFVSPTAASAEN